MTGFVIAMQSEAEGFLRACEILSEKTTGGQREYLLSFGGKSFPLIVCGIGKVNAALAAGRLLERGASRIFNAGLCGAVSSSLKIGGCVTVSECVQYDFDLSALGDERGHVPNLSGARLKLGSEKLASLRLPSAVCASGDRFSDSEEDKALLLELGADVREMELAAVAQACELYGAEGLSVKCVSNVTGSRSSRSYAENKAAALQSLYQLSPDILRCVLD